MKSTPPPMAQYNSFYISFSGALKIKQQKDLLRVYKYIDTIRKTMYKLIREPSCSRGVPDYHKKHDPSAGCCSHCNKQTEITNPICETCLETRNLVRVKKTPDGRGYGVYLLKSVKVDSLLMLYTGDLLPTEEYHSRYDTLSVVPDYGYRVDQDWVVDSRSSYYSIGRYINGTTKKYANVRFGNTRIKQVKESGVSIYTSKDVHVPDGEEVELLLYYGAHYDGIKKVIPSKFKSETKQRFKKFEPIPCYSCLFLTT
jgi:hypothetical protein